MILFIIGLLCFFAVIKALFSGSWEGGFEFAFKAVISLIGIGFLVFVFFALNVFLI